MASCEQQQLVRSAHRIRGFRETVFAEMSAMAAQYGAVNLGQGFPDFPAPGFVKEAALRAIGNDQNQYAHPHGVPELRQEIARDWQSRFGIDVSPVEHVTVTSGATEAIFDIIMGLINPGDEVVTFEPFYDSYPASVTMAGGVMRAVRLQEPEWSFDREALEAQITDRTRLILLNTPHNPTGKIFSRSELDVIAEVALERNLIVITDEVYDRIVFDGVDHVPMATLPGMWDRTLTINSIGKTFSLTGWKIGYATGPSHVIDALRAVHQFVTFASATPFQYAAAQAMVLARENGYYDDLRRDYAARRGVLLAGLAKAGLPVLPAQGSYFLMADFSHLPFSSDADFARWLITEIGVASIPPSAFYLDPHSAPKLVRFCFAKHLATLEDASIRLQHLAASSRES